MIRESSFEEIRKTFDVLLVEGDVVELRIFIKATLNRKAYKRCGWFTDRDKMAKAALLYDNPKTDAIYYSSNACSPAMLKLADNVVLYCKQASRESDIIRRRLFGIDIDPVRPVGLSATESEKLAAYNRALEVQSWLKDTWGFPEPVFGDSGNGYHNDYFIDLPNTPEIKELIKRAQEAIQHHFPKDVAVDVQGFHDANRIWKVYGTVARKGEDTVERPHRRSRLISVPAKKELLSLEILTKLASTAPKPEVLPPQTSLLHTYQPASQYPKAVGNVRPWTPDDLKQWLLTHGAKIHHEKTEGDKHYFVLEACLHNPVHNENHEASAFINSSGVISYKCFHHSCKDVTWKMVRTKLDKEYAESQKRHEEWVHRQSTLTIQTPQPEPQCISGDQPAQSSQAGLTSIDKPKKIKPLRCKGMVNAMDGVGLVHSGRVAVSMVRALRFWSDASLEQTLRVIKKYCKSCRPQLDFIEIEQKITEFYDTPMPRLPVCDNMVYAGLCEGANCKRMIAKRVDESDISYKALLEIWAKANKEYASSHPEPAFTSVSDRIEIKTLVNVPTFVGVDKVTYTLKANTVTTLPAINAKALIRKKAAVEVL